MKQQNYSTSVILQIVRNGRYVSQARGGAYSTELPGLKSSRHVGVKPTVYRKILGFRWYLMTGINNPRVAAGTAWGPLKSRVQTLDFDAS